MRVALVLIGLLAVACAPAVSPDKPPPAVAIDVDEPEPAEDAQASDDDPQNRDESAGILNAPEEAADAASVVGSGGLGLSGVGTTTGLGGLSTLGHGSGTGSQPRTVVPRMVRVGEPVVNGDVPQAVVRRVLRQQVGAFRACYDKQLALDSKLAGRLAIRFQIGQDGSVASTGVDTSVHPDLDRCVQGVVAATQFPKPNKGAVTVRYALTFSPPSTLSGGLAKSEVQRVVKGAAPRVRQCYEQELKKAPKLAGRVVVNMVIAKNGSVSHVSLSEKLLPSLDACIANVMASLQFPPPKSGIVRISYPFVFTTAP